MRKVYNWIANNIDIITILALLFLAFIGITSCSRKTVGVIQKTEVRYIDSTIYHIDTTYVQLPNEKVTDVVIWLDTLRLETEFANSVAYVDTATHTLKGSLENKNKQVPIETKWKERVVYKDSLIYIDRPQPYEVIKYKTPVWARWYLGLTLLGVLLFLLIKTKKYWILFLKKFLVFLLKLFK